MRLYRTREPEISSRVDSQGSSLVVSLLEFKQQIKWDLTDTSEDTLMDTYINAATRQAENFTEIVIQKSTWKTYLDYFADFKMDVSPVDSSTVTIQYYDVNNTLQPLSTTEYSVRNVGSGLKILFDGTMPSLYDRYEAVIVSYSAGYLTADVPYQIKLAIMLQAADYFEGRSVGEVADNTKFFELLYPFKRLG